MNPADRLVGSILRHRAVWVGVVLAVTALAGWRAFQLEFDFSFRTFFLEGRKQDGFSDALARRFGNTGGSSLVAVLHGDDVFRRDVLATIQEMSDAVEAIPHVDRVFSLATVPFIHGQADGLSTQPVTTRVEDGADPAAIGAAMLASPLYVRRLVSPDSTTTAILALLDPEHQGVTPRRPTIASFEDAVTSRRPTGFTVVFTGYPIAETEYARAVWDGFLAAEGAGVLLMALTLYLCFRSVMGVVLPLLAVGLATILTLGFMQAVGQHVSFTNSSVPLQLLVIGIGEVSFLMARYYEEAAHAGSSEDIVRRTAAGVMAPALIAAATTSAGFLALLTGHVALTRELGLAVAFGMAAVFVVAHVLLPAVLVSLPPPPAGPAASGDDGPLGRLLGWIGEMDGRRFALIAAATVGVLVAGAIGARRIVVAQHATRELPAENVVRRAQVVVDEMLSGTFETQVGLRVRDGGRIATPAGLRAVEALQGFLAEQPFVMKTWSVVDYVKELHMAAHGGDPAARRIPDDPALIDQYLLVLSSGGRTSDVSGLIDPTHQVARIVVGTSDLGTGELLGLEARTQAQIGSLPGPPLDARFMGDYWLVSLGADYLVRDFVVSTLTSFVVVFALVALFLRSWRLTLLCMPPNIVPLAVALGLMGFAGIDLRVGTSIVLPVAIGIAVDQTTHYLARLREEWARDRDYQAATLRTLRGTGRGMVYSSAVLVLGFLCFGIPEFRVFFDMGLLSTVTLLAALLANLFLTPALVLRFEPLGNPRAEALETTRRLAGAGSP